MSRRAEVAHAILDNKGPLYITAHNQPDGDAIGSILALTLALEQLDKEVYPVLKDPIPDNLKFLPGINKIINPTDLEVPTIGLLVSLDVSGRPRMNIPEEWSLPIVVIDHHLTGKTAEGLLWSVPTATATAELVEELLREEWDIFFTPEIANCLYLGIATDSGFFKYSNTTPKILRTAARLIEDGASPSHISEHFEVRPLHALQRLAESLSTLETQWNGWLSEMTIVIQEGDRSGFSEGFVDFPRGIPTAEVAAFYKVVDGETVRVSLRSKGFNVAQVAVKLGGGGHHRAAGLSFHGTLEAAKKEVRETILFFKEG